MYVKVKDGAVEAFPYGYRELVRDNPNTSYPSVMGDESLAEHCLYPVAVREIPQPFDAVTQNAEVIDPVLEDGIWVQAWSVTDATPEEVAQRMSDIAQNVRSQRDSLLSQTDWMALSDTTLTPEMAAYRQSLREITDQVGFPTNVVWPIKP